ncbi:MAG: hypothetical protein EBX37_10575 [Alphaproteobacteria bacterium]|nr:hypothetical protein [Alphaproteobacteria bacterium]
MLIHASTTKYLLPHVQQKYYNDIRTSNQKFIDLYGTMASRAVLHPEWIDLLKVAYQPTVDLLELLYPYIYNRLQILKHYQSHLSVSKMYSIKCTFVNEISRHPDVYMVQILDADHVIIDGEVMVVFS